MTQSEVQTLCPGETADQDAVITRSTVDAGTLSRREADLREQSGLVRHGHLRHRPPRPLCDAKFGGTALSRLYDDLYIVPQRDQKTHEALDRVSPELASQHS